MSETSFYGLPLLTPAGRVMRPRPASEGLVRAAVEAIGERPGRVVDVGTGSGAVAIAIASAAPQARVWATDISADAVATARENVSRHGLEGRVVVRRGDLLDPAPGKVDVVVANLPYLPARDATLYPELGDEPVSAVFAKGDGLDPYRRLLDACAGRLAPDGLVAIQLHRNVVSVSRSDLPRLRAGLDAGRLVVGTPRALADVLPACDVQPASPVSSLYVAAAA